jgi:hypothetical protein
MAKICEMRVVGNVAAIIQTCIEYLFDLADRFQKQEMEQAVYKGMPMTMWIKLS